MKFLAILSFLSVAALAVAVPQPEAEADVDVLEKRVDCKKIVALCASGNFIEKTGCQCSGQKPKCDLWACPNGKRVSATPICLLVKARCCLRTASAFMSWIQQLIRDTASLWPARQRLRVCLSGSSEPPVR